MHKRSHKDEKHFVKRSYLMMENRIEHGRLGKIDLCFALLSFVFDKFEQIMEILELRFISKWYRK